MLAKSLTYCVRAGFRLALKGVLGPLAPIHNLSHFNPGLTFRDAWELKALRDFARQPRKPGLRSTHLLVGLSDSREVWLDSGRHFVVSGPAGCGKSVLESFFTFQRIAMGLPVLVLDWVGDGSTREHIQVGLKDAGLPLLKDIGISDVHRFDGLWQGSGLASVKQSMDEMRLVLERLVHQASQLKEPLDKPHLVLISEADWLFANPESAECGLILSLLAQLRAFNVSVGLFVQVASSGVLANCATSIEFKRGAPSGYCEVRSGSLLREGVTSDCWSITTKVPFFFPKES